MINYRLSPTSKTPLFSRPAKEQKRSLPPSRPVIDAFACFDPMTLFPHMPASSGCRNFRSFFYELCFAHSLRAS
ncbi:hypothetical protein TB1_006137 [Malus domestica]